MTETITYLRNGKYHTRAINPDSTFVMVPDGNGKAEGQWHSLMGECWIREHKPVVVEALGDIKKALKEGRYVENTEANQRVLKDMLGGNKTVLVDYQSPWPITANGKQTGEDLQEQIKIASNQLLVRHIGKEGAPLGRGGGTGGNTALIIVTFIVAAVFVLSALAWYLEG